MLHVPQIEFLVFLKLCMSTILPTLRNDITVFTQNRNLGVVFDFSPLLRMEQECTSHPKSIITVSLTMAVVAFSAVCSFYHVYSSNRNQSALLEIRRDLKPFNSVLHLRCNLHSPH